MSGHSAVTTNDARAAACCAAFYEQDGVVELLGDHFHPGGEALSDRLIADLALDPGARVLDVACGPGTTARRLGALGFTVVGLDYSDLNIVRATDNARAAGLSTVTFVTGSADALPFEDASFDAVVCECAVSTFANKPQVAAEVARVLRPGGRFGMSDMARYGDLPEDLATFGRGWSCVDDALPVEGYLDLFVAAGLESVRVVDESDALRALLFDIKKRLLVLGLAEVSGLIGAPDLSLEQWRGLLDRAKALVNDQRIRYARLSFRRPANPP